MEYLKFKLQKISVVVFSRGEKHILRRNREKQMENNTRH